MEEKENKVNIQINGKTLEGLQQIGSRLSKKQIFNEFLKYFNDCLDLDKNCISDLMLNKISICTEEFADKSDAQVQSVEGENDEVLFLGSLGFANGIIERLTGERICAVIDDKTNKIIKFQKYYA